MLVYRAEEEEECDISDREPSKNLGCPGHSCEGQMSLSTNKGDFSATSVDDNTKKVL